MDNIRLGCALCRVLAHRLCNRIRGRQPPPPKPEHHVVCIGLERSGKSTALALLAGEPVDNIQPTNGFHIKDVILDDCMLNVKEIGGSEKIRKYWSHYYSGAQGVMFMVDGTTNVIELETARQAMINALSDSQLCFLPVLLLVTHQDKENCRSPEEIAQLWDVESVYKERIQVCGSSTKHLADLRAAFHSFSHILINGLPTAVDSVKLDMSDVRAMDLDDDDDVVVPS